LIGLERITAFYPFRNDFVHASFAFKALHFFILHTRILEVLFYQNSKNNFAADSESFKVFFSKAVLFYC
jgi:hypothetical protein